MALAEAGHAVALELAQQLRPAVDHKLCKGGQGASKERLTQMGKAQAIEQRGKFRVLVQWPRRHYHLQLTLIDPIWFRLHYGGINRLLGSTALQIVLKLACRPVVDARRQRRRRTTCRMACNHLGDHLARETWAHMRQLACRTPSSSRHAVLDERDGARLPMPLSCV